MLLYSAAEFAVAVGVDAILPNTNCPVMPTLVFAESNVNLLLPPNVPALLNCTELTGAPGEVLILPEAIVTYADIGAPLASTLSLISQSPDTVLNRKPAKEVVVF